MRRKRSSVLVRLFNLVYIAAAGVSIYALCTRPIIKANVHVSLSQDKMGSLLSGLFNKKLSSEEEESEERYVYRAVEERRDVKDYITKEKIASYFPNGYKVDIPVEITATQAFDFKNTKLLDDLIQINLGKIVDNVYLSIEKPLTLMFKDIVEGFAVDTLTDEINKQIAEYFPDGAPASTEEVQEVFNNIYALLEGDEAVTVDELASAILHGGEDSNGVLDIINSRGSKYVPYEEAPTAEEVEADRTVETKEEQKYFVRIDSIEYKHNVDPYNAETTYYDKDGVVLSPQPSEAEVEADRTAAEGEETYFVGVNVTSYVHNTDPYDSSTTYYKAEPYTSDDINDEKIAEKVAEALEGVDGLVIKTPVLCNPQPTEEQVNEDLAKEEKNRIYYVLDENGDPVLPEAYDAAVQYYTVDRIVNDVDTAMAALIDSFLNGNKSGENRAIVREEEPHEDSSDKPKSISENIKDYLYGLIPSNISEKTGTVGEKAPFILLAIIAIFALPWAWFAIVTFIRTLRKKKCWTRPMIVLFWGLPQVIFGLGLTFGTNRAFRFVAQRIDALKDYAQSFNFDIETGCLIPSYVYLGVLALTIIYWLVRKPLKIQYKMEKYVTKVYGRAPKKPRQPIYPRKPKEPRKPLSEIKRPTFPWEE